jgi:hypothetical protein
MQMLLYNIKEYKNLSNEYELQFEINGNPTITEREDGLVVIVCKNSEIKDKGNFFNDMKKELTIFEHMNVFKKQAPKFKLISYKADMEYTTLTLESVDDKIDWESKAYNITINAHGCEKSPEELVKEIADEIKWVNKKISLL